MGRVNRGTLQSMEAKALRPRGTGNVLIEFVRVRVVGAEKRALLDAAAKQGVSLSEFTRQAMTEAVQGLAA